MPRQFKVTVNGNNYQVTVEELNSASPSTPSSFASNAPVSTVKPSVPQAHAATVAPSKAPAVTASASSKDEVAQMGGVIAHIHVKQGQTVKEGERLLDLEAMKMKIPMTASHSGQITRILVAEGDAVENGQPLLTIG